jgi:hypothetical protein
MNTKNTTPAVPLGVPGGAHTVGEVMRLVGSYVIECEHAISGHDNDDMLDDSRKALLAAITKLVSDRDVLQTRLAEVEKDAAKWREHDAAMKSRYHVFVNSLNKGPQ